MAPAQEKAPLGLWKTAVSGGLAGMAEISIMYPTDICKTRAQLSKVNVTMMQTFRTVIAEQGPKGLYRGVVTPILAETPKRAWKFTANQQFKVLLAKTTKDGKSTMATTTMAGSLAGITEALINCPFETIKVRMQAVENLTKYSTSTECFRYLLKHEGIGGLYNGLEAQMWRNGIWNGLYFGTVGTAQIMFPPSETASHGEKLFYKFCTGVVGSMLGTIANTPFDVVKSRMQQQTKPVDGSPLKYRNTLQSLTVVAQEEGRAALYKGLVPRLVRLGPGGGIMIVAFDTISGWLEKY